MVATSWLILVILAGNICLGLSLNQPKLSSCALWNTNATTLANETVVGQLPTGIFINTKNNIYASDRQSGNILIWYSGSLSLNKTISGSFTNPWSLFATDNGDIFVDNGHKNGRVDKWTLNGTNREPVMYVNSSCTGLFIDIVNSFYCSLANEHRVFKLTQHSAVTMPMVVAGTSCPGPLANMLDHPHGIFVDKNYNLFVADTHNNRIQRFESGQLNAVTIAGFGALVTYILNRPTSIVVDADGYLFIVDSGNHRIIRSMLNGFQCLFGCSGDSGSSMNQLNNPQTMTFDKDGNIFVTDLNNHRIQKFSLVQNSCNVPTFATHVPWVITNRPTTIPKTTIQTILTIRTTTTSSIFTPIQCSSYTTNNDGSRRADNSKNPSQFSDGLTSPFGASPTWVRFSGSAGTLLASQVVPMARCGSTASGWYSGSHPPAGATITGTVCFSLSNNNCYYSIQISVTNCNGFFVYLLPAAPCTPCRYCTV